VYFPSAYCFPLISYILNLTVFFYCLLLPNGSFMPDRRQELTLLTVAAPAARAWEGFTAAGFQDAVPEAPQGDYADGMLEPLAVPEIGPSAELANVELLAPAGGPDAAYAAFHYGADAIYLGLEKFSARAEAENFTLEETAEVVAYAHSLTPPRRVFVTVNTLLRNDELPELVETLAALEEMQVDALILQDLGVYWLIKQHFPGLELHASTQLSVHNRAGAATLHRLGFDRVVLARELTFEEVRDVTATAGVETEVFIHGALCYSYSGLCLFSSQTLGRSGNRGKCAYSCRHEFTVSGAPATLRDGSDVKRDPHTGFPFSMKDLALPDHLPALRAAGVSCFKIEGRKKSPLYVATTTDYYRKLIDGRLDESSRAIEEADLQTVFSRPWTRLFMQSHKDKEVADRDTVGHRGALIGSIERVHYQSGEAWIHFTTARALERHDGLQIDLPVLGKPFGFAVDRLRLVKQGRRGANTIDAFEAAAGDQVEILLPGDSPSIPVGAPVYCSSSQAVKRAYRFGRPKAGLFRPRRQIDVAIEVTPRALIAIGRIQPRDAREQIPPVRVEQAGRFELARKAEQAVDAARAAFGKLGDTALTLGSLEWRNDGLFVPVSQLNALRRSLCEAAAAAIEQARDTRIRLVQQAVSSAPAPVPRSAFRWSLKVDRLSFLDQLEPCDWEDLDELVVDIARDPGNVLEARLAGWRERLGPERIRLALPALTRKWEEKPIVQKIERLRAAGFGRWEAANLSAWSFLGVDPLEPARSACDLAADWSVYVLNRLAAEQLTSMGVSRFALSPEDGLANMRPLLAEFGPRAVVIVYQDTPLFLAESCAYANLIGGCPGKANCRFESMEMVSSFGERVTALDYHCRTIVINDGAFCLSEHLAELAGAGAISLRADFVYRAYDATTVRDRWRLVRAGRAIPGGQAANIGRGVL
jgi:putative protease